MNKSELKVDWCSHEAAKYACLNWHYSKCMPVGKIVKIGAWENDIYIGCVLFSRGANKNMGKKYRCNQTECVELTRIALSKHKSFVSEVMAISIRFLKKSNPLLKLVVSYADEDQGHNGGIYQATNFIYDGLSSKSQKVFFNGKWSHKKTVDDSGVCQENLKKKYVQGKHRYLMPLNKKMRKQILLLSKPYPKRVKQDNSENHSEIGGAEPTHTLQSNTKGAS